MSATQLTVNRNQLKAILPSLRKIARGVNGLPILREAIRIDAKPGETRFSVTDLEVWFSHTIDAGCPESFIALVSLEQLRTFVLASSGDYIEIIASGDLEGDYSMRATDGEVTVEFDTWPAIEYPSTPTLDDKLEWRSFDPETLRESLSFVSLAASTDAARYNLNGVYVDQLDGTDRPQFVATDGHRLHADSVGRDALPNHIMPSTAVNTLLGAIKGKPAGQIEWAPGQDMDEPSSYVARYRQSELIYRPIAGEYPTWRQVVPKDAHGRLGFEYCDAYRAVDTQCKLLKANPETRKKAFATVQRDIECDELTFQNKATCISRAPADITIDDTFRAGMNMNYFRDALAGFEGKRIALRFKPDPGTIENHGGILTPIQLDTEADRFAVVMPARI